MRKILLATPMLLLAGAALAQTPTWQYGAGNGDGVQYQGPKPTYNFAYGPGNGDGVASGQTAKENFAYGGENSSGVMMQMTPEQQAQRQQTAAPQHAPVRSAGQPFLSFRSETGASQPEAGHPVGYSARSGDPGRAVSFETMTSSSFISENGFGKCIASGCGSI